MSTGLLSKYIPTPKVVGNENDASAGNRTWGSRMASGNFTTKPLMLPWKLRACQRILKLARTFLMIEFIITMARKKNQQQHCFC
jgi:hypothetical protein